MIKVLVAEDEMFVRIGLINAINWERYGMQVVGDVADGKEAWEFYQREKPDLVITDLKMPAMDGLQLIERIRVVDKAIPVIILTCVEEFSMVHKALRLGVTDYIMKLTMSPEDMETVLEKVGKELGPRLHAPVSGPTGNKSSVSTLIRDYLFLQLYSVSELERLIGQVNPSFTGRRLLLLAAEVDHYERLMERFKDEKGELVRKSLINVLQEVLNNHKRGLVIDEDARRYLFVFPYDDNAAYNGILQSVTGIASQIQKVMGTYFDVTVTFGVSSVRDGYRHLAAQYREAKDCLAYKYVLGTGRLIASNAVSESVAVDRARVLFDRLLEAIDDFPLYVPRKKMREKVQHVLEAGNACVPAEVQQLLLQLIQLPVLFCQPEEPGAGKVVSRFLGRLERCETLEESLHAFISHMNEILRLIAARKPYSKEVQELIAYIDTQYVRDITVGELASIIHLSPNYISSLFKKETGLGIIDYLNQVRVEMAGELLMDTPLKSYEIAEKVGFSDHSYFSRVFKRWKGCTPREYRNHWGEPGEWKPSV
jgi:two-component system, response regulator YesN